MLLYVYNNFFYIDGDVRHVKCNVNCDIDDDKFVFDLVF